MKICYGRSNYLSHRREAGVYRDLIGSRHTLVRDPSAADVVILHLEPRDYSALYQANTMLMKKHVIAYCVWEASELPDVYKQSLSHVQEIWTCSSYCAEIFKRYHRNVACIPHVIERDKSFSDADLAYVKRAIEYDPKCKYFLTIALRANRRKNLDALLRAFQRGQRNMPGSRLIIKTTRADSIPSHSIPYAIWLPDFMTHGQLNALYHLASAYVSTHHSEGWGLTMSDAMALEKPVIATVYSGNLQFMNANNSFLVEYTEEHIHKEDCCDLFHNGMKWAYPVEEDIQRKLLLFSECMETRSVAERIQRASQEIQSFNRETVRSLILKRLDNVLASL